MMERGSAYQTRVRAMIFYSRWGYLVVVFFVVAVFIAGGVSTAYHLRPESTSVLLFLFWGPLCVGFGRKLGTPEKSSTLFWIPMEYWGYGLIGLGALSAYLEWDKIATRGFWREAQQVQEKRIWASLPSSLRIAWKGVLKPRHFLGVRLAVMTMSWISSSDRRSMSM